MAREIEVRVYVSDEIYTMIELYQRRMYRLIGKCTISDAVRGLMIAGGRAEGLWSDDHVEVAPEAN